MLHDANNTILVSTAHIISKAEMLHIDLSLSLKTTSPLIISTTTTATTTTATTTTTSTSTTTTTPTTTTTTATITTTTPTTTKTTSTTTSSTTTLTIATATQIITPVYYSKNSQMCNMDNCRLGKCLKNGTCKCSYPVLGKNCDKIDECLIAKCLNVLSLTYMMFKT